MVYSSVGDLSRYYHMRNSNYTVKSQLAQMTQEVTTGVKADIGKHLRGDVSGLAAMETRLTRMAAFKQTAAETATLAESMQAAMDVVATAAEDSGPLLMTANTEGLVERAAMNAAQNLETVLSTLNTATADQYLFGGTDYDSAPMPSYDALMTQVQAQVSGATTADDIITALDDWFAAPVGGGGFSDTVYAGDPAGREAVQVSENASVTIAATANDDAFKDVIKGMVISALVADGALAGDATERQKLTLRAGTVIAEGQYKLANLQADVGMVQETVEKATTKTAADITSVTIARTKLIEADAYEASTAITQLETQLEAIYSLTARLTSRSLADYI